MGGIAGPWGIQGVGKSRSGDLETLVPQALDEPSASLQITQHRLGQQADRFAFLAPLELLLSVGQMLQAIPQPEQGRFAMAHSPRTRVIVDMDSKVIEASRVPIDANRVR